LYSVIAIFVGELATRPRRIFLLSGSWYLTLEKLLNTILQLTCYQLKEFSSQWPEMRD